MAGWLRRDTHELGFMWDVPEGEDGFGPGDWTTWPLIRYLILDVSGGTPNTTPAADSFIWNANFAWFLPAAGVNARGHVGGMAARAGGTGSTGAMYPGGNAWIYDDYSSDFEFETCARVHRQRKSIR